MKRKLLIVFIAIISVFACMLAVPACKRSGGKEEETGDGLIYTELSDKSCAVAGVEILKSNKIDIPAEHNGMRVTEIAAGAFENCLNLKRVNLPVSVNKIGDGAFAGCRHLERINIPQGVQSIGYRTFDNCISLISLTLPEGVQSIGDSAFRNCYDLESVTIPDSVTTIGMLAFYQCMSLKNLALGNSVREIGFGAFYRCSEIKTVIIPDNAINIEDCAFRFTPLNSVCFLGTEYNWYAHINITGTIPNELTEAEKYYYSETQPVEEGNYWHFAADNKTPLIW